MNIENAKAQMRKGILEYCILSILKKRDLYTSDIIKALKENDLIVVEGTLYPLLNRMQKNGWLESTWDTQTESGHPRRFYQLSKMGEMLLPKMIIAHQNNNKSLEKLEKDS